MLEFYHLMYRLDTSLCKMRSPAALRPCQMKTYISKSSSATGCFGFLPVKARVTLAFRLIFKVIMMMAMKFSQNAKVTRALTGRSLVRPAADHDFENLQFCKFLCFYLSLYLAENKQKRIRTFLAFWKKLRKLIQTNVSYKFLYFA